MANPNQRHARNSKWLYERRGSFEIFFSHISNADLRKNLKYCTCLVLSYTHQSLCLWAIYKMKCTVITKGVSVCCKEMSLTWTVYKAVCTVYRTPTFRAFLLELIQLKNLSNILNRRLNIHLNQLFYLIFTTKGFVVFNYNFIIIVLL